MLVVSSFDGYMSFSAGLVKAVSSLDSHACSQSDYLQSSISTDCFLFSQLLQQSLLPSKLFRLSDIGEAAGLAELKARGRSAPSAID